MPVSLYIINNFFFLHAPADSFGLLGHGENEFRQTKNTAVLIDRIQAAVLEKNGVQNTKVNISISC